MARRITSLANKTLTEDTLDKTFVYPEITEEPAVEETSEPEESKKKTGKVINCQQLALREGPGTEYKMIEPIPVGTKVQILGEEAEFYKVIAGTGHEGYAMAEYIKK